MMATQTMHRQLAEAINDLIRGREYRLDGAIQRASDLEYAGEAKLRKLFTADQVDTLMTAWELSLTVNPLELPEWRSILDPE